MLGQPMKSDPSNPPRFGDVQALSNADPSDAEASPHQCVGVAVTLLRSVYLPAGINDVAEQSLIATDVFSGVGVSEGVVALSSPVAANALFARFSQQWASCDGTTLTQHGGKF
jgi:hypothetical protein